MLNKTFIYLDESGDLGFNKGSSNYFVISFIAMNAKTNLILKRKIKKVKKKHKIGKDVEIKGNKSNHSLRTDILRAICSLPIEIYSITTKKQGINKSLRKDTNIFYNYMVNLILVPYIEQSKISNLCLMADSRINKVSKGMRFGDYLKYKIFFENSLYKIKLDIKYLDSLTSYGLQAVDFIANSIFKSYEQGNDRYYKVLRGRIIKDKRLYFNS
ncbi:hypothetical protein CVT91_05665 [Candidatus Atribacteria bacterium HGW-Atribacteria-1]|nr:MAG: hypothetical protein CVT91_05665 [Candidatus Atribacteria bacterium HGW-Atribacteria-1]